jgi:hypothetical protein
VLVDVSVTDWLLDADPAIRWQVLRDLVDTPAEEVAAERARVAAEGWGARLLALQGPAGTWTGAGLFPEFTSTCWSLMMLRDFGAEPGAPAVRRAIELVREHGRWEHAGQPFFEGEVEPCINGKVVALGASFDVHVTPVVDRLLGEQMADGGWNCEQEKGSVRGSFHTTIAVLEGLLEWERATGGTAASIAARRRGEDYLLERRLLRRRSTGEIIDPAFTRFSFPTFSFYDVLRALDYLRDAGGIPDERVAAAVGLVLSRRDADGRWPLENDHPGERHFPIDDGERRPGRWNTLRALRVLRWAEGMTEVTA